MRLLGRVAVAFLFAVVGTLTVAGGAGATLVGPTSAASTAVDQTTCTQWLRGVDVSSSQININWHTVSHSGVYFTLIKVSEGLGYVNTELHHQATGAGNNGIPWGGYDYANPKLTYTASHNAITSNATADARYFVRHLLRGWSLPPVLDLELSTGIVSLAGPKFSHVGNVVLWAVTWLREAATLTHTTPTIYTGGQYAWSGKSALQDFPLWVAAYPLGEGKPAPHGNACGLGYPVTGGWHGFSVWQYSDATHIGGFQHALDVDAATPLWLETSHLGILLTVPPQAGVNRFAAGVLTVGSKGSWVRHVQRYLKARGVYHGRVDAHFGPATRAAVIAWQRILHIPTDGEWGPVTGHATSRYNSKHHLTI